MGPATAAAPATPPPPSLAMANFNNAARYFHDKEKESARLFPQLELT